MLDVFFTVDVEVWCDNWQDIDRKFPAAFRSYVYGPTPEGEFGLPFQADLLKDHGMKGVFFVEPLFSARFGPEPLQEIVGILKERQQEIQLHLHTEWVDEARVPLLPDVRSKRQHLRYFSRDEQASLIATGARLLREAGVAGVDAFRAGSFAFNHDTLPALAGNGIAFDSSYNAVLFGADSGVMPGVTLVESTQVDGVHEYPMTVYRDGTGALRHAQVTSCSYGELETLLWQALHAGRRSFVILSHNFEALNPAKTRVDKVVVNRLRKLFAFLDHNRDCFRVRGFEGLEPHAWPQQPEPLHVPRRHTYARMAEQAFRWKYR